MLFYAPLHPEGAKGPQALCHTYDGLIPSETLSAGCFKLHANPQLPTVKPTSSLERMRARQSSGL